MYTLSARSKRHLVGVDSRLVEVVSRALEITKIDFGIPVSGGLRTAEQQNQLYKKGLSKLDGYTQKSRHQSGKAVDVFAYVDDRASWDIGDLAQVATAMFAAAQEAGVNIEWGGHWKSFVDAPHFELID